MTQIPLSVFPLARGRTHEVCGAGSVGFAFALAAQLGGQLVWIHEEWTPEQINPEGFADIFDPRGMIVCRTKSQSDTLAVAEEALRSGAAGLVVMEIGKPLGLTEGRRLQLAARDGNATGLAIIPEGMGSNAAQTRWRCTPVFDPNDSTLHRWEIIKNKTGTFGVWHVRWDQTARRIVMASATGD